MLCPEVILHILRSPELIGLASRLCRQWRHTATLVTSTEPTAFGSDAELRRFCVACPLLRTLRIDGDARITDAGGEAVSVLRCLIEFSLHGWGSTAERTLAALGKLHTLTSIDLSWCAMISDRAILNLALGRLPALRFLSMRGCRRVGDAAVAELLRASTDLTSLDVSFCSRLGDSTVRALSSMQHMHTLSMRSLAQVTTDSLPAIASLRSLTELDVSYCPEVRNALGGGGGSFYVLAGQRRRRDGLDATHGPARRCHVRLQWHLGLLGVATADGVDGAGDARSV